MTPAYLKKRIAETQPEVVELYERNVPFSDFHVSIPVLAFKKNDDFDTILDQFFANYAGTFTALIRRGAKDQRKNGERIVLQNAPVAGDTNMQVMAPINGLPQVKSEQQLRQEILAEVRREMELENLRQEVLELQRQHTIQNGLESRLTTVLEKLFFSSKLAQATTPATPIQGTPAAPIQDGMHDINQLTEAQTEQLEEVVAEIYQHLGLNTLVKVRDALRRDPGLAKKLDLFI